MRTKILFVVSALLLTGCSNLTGQTLPVDSVQNVVGSVPSLLSGAQRTAKDSIELGKLGIDHLKKTASSAQLQIDQARAKAAQLQQGAAKIVDGVEQVKAATR